MMSKFKCICLVFFFPILASCAAKEPATPGHGAVVPIEVEQEVDEPSDSIPPDAVAGRILDETGAPLEGAVVRLQATSVHTVTDADGNFILQGVPLKEPFRITAYVPGYFIKEADTRAGVSGVIIVLHAHDNQDHVDYTFLTAGFTGEGEGENTGCAECHSATAEESAQGITLPYDEWLLDAHAQSAQNPRFLSMYNGTDLNGNQSPPTVYISQKDYGAIPLPPTLDESYFGPGFRLDFPDNPGNCAACHLPVLAINEPYGSDPNLADGVALEGVTCDFCHKVWNVKLNTNSGLPYPNMPGMLSFEFRRPAEEHQFFAGPFDDVAPGEDTYSPLQTQSEYCAPCHFGDFWNTRAYNSFGEWLASPYAETGSDTFKTCQDCHMPPLGMDYFARTEKGGLQRDPNTIFSHRMPGAVDEKLLQNTAQLELEAYRQGSQIVVETSIFNDQAGHHIPTDSPLRQIFLVVQASNPDGSNLPLAEGPVLPTWASDLENLPGVYFAKILEQLWTEVVPTGAYWTQTRLVEDTRLPALETKKARFIFDTLDDAAVSVEARLVFRRAFYDLMQQKDWETPDILMEQSDVQVP